MDSVAATATSTHVDVDGNDTRDGRVIRLGAINAKKRARGFRISDTEIRPLIFSAIKLTGPSLLRVSLSSFLRQTTISILGMFPNTLVRFLSGSTAALSENVKEQRGKRQWISQTFQTRLPMKDRRKQWSIKSGKHFNANLFSGRNLRA